MNASGQETSVRRGSDDKCDDPSTTPNADDECVTPKKARTDDHEDYSDATIIDSTEMHSDMEADDRPFTTVTYKKARPAGIPIIFKLTDLGASLWKANPNKLASEVVTAAKEKVQSFRVNRDGNFSTARPWGFLLVHGRTGEETFLLSFGLPSSPEMITIEKKCL
ncbi:hypothetical protein HPB52_017167 [Rhipicephalus sanguineus]|uniref:Uncharacterized protein n=1 Tax=Rhipicephalus sanguineus TaxID=34632 RepID=A0A9D4PWZ5_RHISA|nr:hypothetical protein HPB52_017167 [Rhipicephalus sanguineus]